MRAPGAHGFAVRRSYEAAWVHHGKLQQTGVFFVAPPPTPNVRCSSRRVFGPSPECGPGEIHAGDLEDEVLAAPIERAAEVADRLASGRENLDEGKDEPVGLVHACQDL